jgi:hypothetical protein
MDNFGKNWQLINILFCGYQRRLEIGDCRSTKCAETYTRPGHRVPQRVIITDMYRIGATIFCIFFYYYALFSVDSCRRFWWN